MQNTKKIIKRIATGSSAAVLMLASLISLSLTGEAHAASTKTSSSGSTITITVSR